MYGTSYFLSFIYPYSVLELPIRHINCKSIFRVNYNFMILHETYSMIFLQHQFLILTEITIHLSNHCLFIGNLVVALWSSSSSMVNIKALFNNYCKLASTNTSCLEPHLGIYRLLMKGKLDVYMSCDLLGKSWFSN